MKNLPMDLLRTFVTISQLGGFTQAGELLGRSQPAISLQIKRLEELIGKTLLVRKGQTISLTSSGELIFQYAQKILALNDEAIGRFDKEALSGAIHLGIPSEFATTLLPKIISQFANTYPNVTLEVTCALSRQLCTESERHKYDLILALYDAPEEAGDSLIKIDELVWVTSNKYDLHADTKTPLVVAPDGCIYRNRGINILNSNALPWHIVYTIPDLTGILSAIREGLGVTVLTKSTVPEDLQVIRPSDRFPTLGKLGISLLKPKGNNIDAVERLAEYLMASLS